MKKPTATGTPSIMPSHRLAVLRPATFLLALASGTALMACGPGVVDLRTDGNSTSGSSANSSSSSSTGAGGAACGEACTPIVRVLITTSGAHGCAITPSGALRCWGWNDQGQLGNGTQEWSLAPVDVAGLSSGVVAVSGGIIHTCARTASGAVQCWGNGDHGQLGNGSTGDSLAPAEIEGSSSLASVVVGGTHTCAVTTQGAARCWGFNNVGQLGDGSTTESHSPGPVAGLSSGVIAVAAGNLHSCAVTSSGGVKCWGYNDRGQLGDGSTTTRLAPVAVVGLSSGVVAISASYGGTCALLASGGVQCWGGNQWGQAGDGTDLDSSVPVEVAGLAPGIVAIGAGATHACALTASGAVQCWGGNQWGQLGNGTTTNSLAPVDVMGLSSGVIAIATGGGTTCAVLTSGGVKCWGYNDYGALGDGTLIDRSLPVDVVGF
jgi:alpha-tubulin suppressor-like RCC1 family protein